jgi:DNA polymerase-1
MESDLSDQFKLIDELLETMKVHVASADGYEGDDVIGTYARQAVEEGIDEVVIVTGDRDLLQLVNDKTKILMTITGMTKTALFDATMVEEKYGVTPAQFIDYKALIGDQSDGYPGITGIGPKTAASLLQKFGTFENIFMKLEQLPEGTALKLATDAEQGSLAKKLAAIILDAPVHLKLDTCKVEDLDLASVRKGFEAHQFKSLIARLDAKNPPPVEEVKIEVKNDKDEEQLGFL